MHTAIKIPLLWMLALPIAASTPDAERRVGYLDADEFDVTYVLEPAPVRGDPRYEADRKIFRATRRMIGTERWAYAVSDAEITNSALLRDFSCSVGVALSEDNAPKLLHVLRRASTDTGLQSARAKNFYKRHRPFTIDRGQICQSPSELYDKKAQRMSYDYPSGHTTRGWTWALVLTAIAPDRAQQILERGRAYGDSRFICGAHNKSAVEAGIVSASATMGIVSTKVEYQTDVGAARAELKDLRTRGEKPVSCEIETKLLNPNRALNPVPLP